MREEIIARRDAEFAEVMSAFSAGLREIFSQNTQRAQKNSLRSLRLRVKLI